MKKFFQFGDLLHIDGEPHIFLEDGEEGFRVVGRKKDPMWVSIGVIDEFKKKNHRDALMELWRTQGHYFSRDHIHSEVFLDEVMDWLENNREQIVEILNS